MPPIDHLDRHWFRPTTGGLSPTGVAISPHAPDAQHGSAIAALVTRAAERLDAPTPMDIVRVTVDLTRRIPVGLTTTEVDVRRAGKRVQVVDVTVCIDGQPVTRSEVIRMRSGDVIDPDALPGAGESRRLVEDPAHDLGIQPWGDSAFMQGISPVFERWDRSAARYWVTIDDQFVEGEPMSPFVRAAAAADVSLSGGRLLPDRPSTNADLHVAFHRRPVGTRFRIDSEIEVDPGGWGSSVSTLSDRHGRVASLTKSILFLGDAS